MILVGEVVHSIEIPIENFLCLIPAAEIIPTVAILTVELYAALPVNEVSHHLGIGGDGNLSAGRAIDGDTCALTDLVHILEYFALGLIVCSFCNGIFKETFAVAEVSLCQTIYVPLLSEGMADGSTLLRMR